MKWQSIFVVGTVWLWTPAAVVVVGGSFGFGLISGRADEAGVVFLGGEPVYIDEYAFHESRLRTAVAGRFLRKHGWQMSADFWTTRPNGLSPTEVLREEVLRSLARTRMVQELAVERGILREAMTHRQWVDFLEAENSRRRDLKASGQILYGPVVFRQDTYYQIWFEQIMQALQKDLLDQWPSGETSRSEREAAVRKQIEKTVEVRVEAWVKGVHD